MKMWDGRFSKTLDEKVNAFNSSIQFDIQMFDEDIEGTIAHATMLESVAILTAQERDQIISACLELQAEYHDGTLVIDPTSEDIHMFIESQLTIKIGQAGKKVHTARSRNDQVATDLKLYVRKQLIAVDDKVTKLITVILAKAEQHTKTIMPCYTHLQRAQPITFAHHLMSYTEMLLRDKQRLADCLKRLNTSPLGSCAAAGTTYPIDRMLTAELLHFTGPTANSIDGVSDRDFCLEASTVIATIMIHLSRFSEEIIAWCSWEFRFMILDDSFATGSSIMPQKKNPDIAELVRGKSGRAIGNMTTLYTMLKGLPLAYNKDMQEDKEAIFDSLHTVLTCLDAFTPMLETATICVDNMKKAAETGFINATDCADYLVKNGLAFREAYKIVGKIVAKCIEQNLTLETLTLEQYQQESPLFAADIFTAIDMVTCVEKRTSYGGPAAKVVRQHIAAVRRVLTDEEN
ncbi:MAG: argininosuccinate lyase [Culicoidibacterales bacterium]